MSALSPARPSPVDTGVRTEAHWARHGGRPLTTGHCGSQTMAAGHGRNLRRTAPQTDRARRHCGGHRRPDTGHRPRVPQPAGSQVYELLTGHPEREPGELVFVADLTCELRAWPHDTWAAVGGDPEQVAQAVIGCWRDGQVDGRQVDDLTFEEARSSSGRP